MLYVHISFSIENTFVSLKIVLITYAKYHHDYFKTLFWVPLNKDVSTYCILNDNHKVRKEMLLNSQDLYNNIITKIITE